MQRKPATRPLKLPLLPSQFLSGDIISTRCQIRFKDEISKAQVYRHSDGYPDTGSGVIADLRRLKAYLEETRAFRDAEYLGAQFIFYDKLKAAQAIGRQETISDLLKPGGDQPLYLLGHGVEDPKDGLHGDEEFAYEVDLTDRDWLVKISDHLLSYSIEDVSKMSFKDLPWNFEGKLEEAYKKYVGSRV